MFKKKKYISVWFNGFLWAEQEYNDCVEVYKFSPLKALEMMKSSWYYDYLGDQEFSDGYLAFIVNKIQRLKEI